jgi:uncharacterized membrane protein
MAPAPARQLDEKRFESFIGTLLRVGVILSAVVVFAGGIHYLLRYGSERQSWHEFHGEPDALRHVSGIVRYAAQLHSRGFIQLGLLILIATPVARVAFSVVGFALERDWFYVCVTLMVLALLLFGLAYA